MAQPKFVLIDGSSYLYRAFHALPPLSNKLGEPTGALFGVVNMLRSHLKQNPERIAFVLDAPGENFRHALYAAYKANRPPTPPDLVAQIEPLKAIVEALGIPLLCIPDAEADDVIGTLAIAAKNQGYRVDISTGDKDFAQLVCAEITLSNTMTNTVLDEQGVLAKFGVNPAQIVDLLTLTGDKIDNVPGVEKCGPVTAVKWLATFGSLERLIEQAASVGGKIGDNLRQALSQLPLSKQLVTIRTDMALPVAPESLSRQPPQLDKLRELFARYEFKAALKELEESSAAQDAAMAKPITAPAPAPAPEKHYTTVLDDAALEELLRQLRSAELFAFDTETSALDAHQADLVGMSFSWRTGHAAYIPLAHDYPGAPRQLPLDKTLALIKPLLEDPSKLKVGQHGKYDMHVLARYGIGVRGYAFDTMLESYVLNSTITRHDMDSLAAHYLNFKTIRFEDVAGKGAKQLGFHQVDITIAAEYAAEDADVTLRLHERLWAGLQAQAAMRSVFTEIEMPLVPVLARMESKGMLIDAQLLERQSRDHRSRMQLLIQQAYALVGRAFSLDSPKQLQQILFHELGLSVKTRTPTGQASTNEEALEKLADDHELPRLLLNYRTLAKLVGTYTEKLPKQINPRTGRVHTSFHQATAATGRLSSSDPNLQNIPIRTDEGRQIRQAFIAAPGHKIIAADYSQIELRIMAHLSEDANLLAAFKQGLDIHTATAAEVFGVGVDQVDSNQRRAAKAINFGLIYGMGAHGLAQRLAISRQQGHDYIERYFARYPGVRAYMENTRAVAKAKGYVETVFGRRLYLREINASNANLRAGAERAAINAPMQGTAADVIKRAMIAVDPWLERFQGQASMILQVHDELVLEVREELVPEIGQGLSRLMMAAADLKVPLEVDVGVGDNWDEAH